VSEKVLNGLFFGKDLVLVLLATGLFCSGKFEQEMISNVDKKKAKNLKFIFQLFLFHSIKNI
jgi:hypothetical protein